MNVIMIIPTGLGAPIGGHAGDATPAARLLAATCDTLILHPNVVNASDINEMPENSLYVMGVTIDDLLSGYIGLRSVFSNRIAVAVNRPIPNELVNTVSAARSSLGIDAFLVGLPTPLRMIATFDALGAATGTIEGGHEAASYLSSLDEDFGAVAVLSAIEVDRSVAEAYMKEQTVNPWGGVEAKLTRILTDALKVPCAHAPFGHTLPDDFNDIVDPRLAAEIISMTYSFCVLKGLSKAPEIVETTKGLNFEDINALVTPANCFGTPHRLCLEKGIPIISVRENSVLIQNNEPYPHIEAATYSEAAGFLLAMKKGITLESLSRPIKPTLVIP